MTEQSKLKGRTHGKSYDKVYYAYQNMHQRCTSQSKTYYKYYGARGIKICERWHTFENFYTDMGDPPSSSHSLGRINNDGNYCKENCRWETVKEQERNKQDTVYKTNNEGVKKTLAEWAEIVGTSYNTMITRHKRGWSDQDTIYGKGN